MLKIIEQRFVCVMPVNTNYGLSVSHKSVWFTVNTCVIILHVVNAGFIIYLDYRTSLSICHKPFNNSTVNAHKECSINGRCHRADKTQLETGRQVEISNLGRFLRQQQHCVRFGYFYSVDTGRHQTPQQIYYR